MLIYLSLACGMPTGPEGIMNPHFIHLKIIPILMHANHFVAKEEPALGGKRKGKERRESVSLVI